MTEPLLVVRDLSVRVGARTLVEGASLTAEAGEIVAILGPNGAGKSTLLTAIAGVREAAGGEVLVRGARAIDFGARARAMWLVPDDAVMPTEMTLGVALGLAPTSAAVRALGVVPLLGARASEVSRGESKRAQLAAALDAARPVLLLDEPFGAFDPRQLREVLPIVRSSLGARAIVVTIHQMNIAERIADRFVLLNRGRVLAAGTLGDLRERVGLSSASLDDVFLALLDAEPADAA